MKLVIYNTANSRTAEDRIGRRSIRFKNRKNSKSKTSATGKSPSKRP